MTLVGLSEDGNQRGSGRGGSIRAAYDSPLRREQARATRVAIAAAARRLFAERGWAGTRVRDVAREAGVSEPTVFAAYGSKAGLANALVEAAELAGDTAELERALASSESPTDQLAALVHLDRELFEHGGDIIALLRDAGGSEPELHAAYRDGRDRGDRMRADVFAGWPPAAFRDGVDAAAAADAFAALCSIDTYRVLTEERGWTPDRVERWWHESLRRLLLAGP